MKRLATLSLHFVVLAFMLLFSSFCKAPSAIAQGGRWEKLGERKVNFALDRDEIIVGRADGRFDGLKIIVRRGAINMHKMVVHFGNGESQELELRNSIPRGGESRVIDLPGNNRVITKVVLWYDTKDRARQRAELELWGRH
jgi:Protein of unknown function (DUF2541)